MKLRFIRGLACALLGVSTILGGCKQATPPTPPTPLPAACRAGSGVVTGQSCAAACGEYGNQACMNCCANRGQAPGSACADSCPAINGSALVGPSITGIQLAAIWEIIPDQIQDLLIQNDRMIELSSFLENLSADNAERVIGHLVQITVADWASIYQTAQVVLPAADLFIAIEAAEANLDPSSESQRHELYLRLFFGFVSKEIPFVSGNLQADDGPG